MELHEAGQLGTVNDVANLVNIFSSIMTTMLPILGCCLIFYVGTLLYKRHKKKSDYRKKQKEVNKKIKEQQKIQSKQQVNLNKSTPTNNQIFSDENAMMQRLNNTENKYYDNRFDSLALEFDENGRAK